MEHSPSLEAHRFAASQEIPRILLNPKFHHRIHNSPPAPSILNQLNLVHTPTSYFLKIRLILSSHLRLGLPSCHFPSGFPTKNLHTPLLSPIRATCPVHLMPVYDNIALILYGVKNVFSQNLWRKPKIKTFCI
jgi:hypothetical protein